MAVFLFSLLSDHTGRSEEVTDVVKASGDVKGISRLLSDSSFGAELSLGLLQ